FGQAVATNAPEMEDLRQDMERICGRDAMIELSFHLAVSRFYPTVKRAMGYAQSCSLVQVRAARPRPWRRKATRQRSSSASAAGCAASPPACSALAAMPGIRGGMT